MTHPSLGLRSIRATCETCGDVSITNFDVVVRICVDTDESTYHFWCPGCRYPVVKECSRRIRDLLIVSDCRVVSWFLPAELFATHEGPPIALDDLLVFHESIDDELSELQS